MHIDDALKARRSVRAFKRDPLSRELVEEILTTAALAPSNTNVQPWQVHVVAGEVRDQLEREVLAYRETEPADAAAEFPRANKRKEPYVSRMRTLGKAMYGLLEIPKGDAAAGWRQWGRNYSFFDAPVGLIFTIDKELDQINWVDLGLFAMAIMLAAKARGVDTCALGAWNNYWTVTRRILDVPEDRYIVFGMAMGYADETAAVNTLVAEREPHEVFATFHGF